MASVTGKTINGRRYYYLTKSARVDGAPRIVSQRYLGTAEDIAAAVRSVPSNSTPTSVSRLPFGDAAAAWATLRELRVAELVDEIVGRGRTAVSAGTYVALAALHRVVASNARNASDTADASGSDLAAWWPTTAAERFVRPRPPAGALHPRRIWRAWDRIGPEHLGRIEAELANRVTAHMGGGGPVLVVDVPNAATYADRDGGATWDSAAAPMGLALAVTLDGAVPLSAHPYRLGPDGATSYADVIARLDARHRAPADGRAVTAIVDGGQGARLDIGLPLGTSYVAPLSPGDHPELLAARGSRQTVDAERFPGVTAWERRARIGGVDRRVIGVHSPAVQDAQEQALARDLGQAIRRLAELSAALRDGVAAPSREEVAAEVTRIARFRWGERVLSTRLDHVESGRLRLDWQVDEAALRRLRGELFGRQLLVTDHEDWAVGRVLTAYRARYRVEATLRQLGPVVVRRPWAGWHWTEARIGIHLFVAVLATTVTHLMRWRAQRAGLDLSALDLLARLAGIDEVRLTSTSTGGRPRVRRLIAEQDDTGRQLFDVFALDRYAP